MTAVTDPPPQAFRLGQLWTDTRYRSVTIQIIALVLFLSAGYWLIGNVVQNLAALGKTFSFRFLGEPASYDINQRLIDYTSRSSHATAAVVGILNTLLIAVLGCIAATVIGVVAGVARLSRNWIVSRLVTVYIEVVRNTPLLIQILLFAAVFSTFLPQPREAESLSLFGLVDTGIVATNRGFYMPGLTFGAGSWVVVAAFIGGIVAAVAWGRHARRVLEDNGRELPVFPVKLALVFLPALAVVLVMSLAGLSPIGVESPELRGFNYQGGIFARNSLVALWFALSIYTGGFIAENVRAGIMAVSKGQTEAAYALGLRPNRTMSLIILPQALRVIIPPLISQYLNLTKNSSLAIAVGYMDATATLGGITLNQTGREMETLLLLMAFYLSISLTISMIMNLYNEQVKLVERTSAAGMTLTFARLLDGFRPPYETLKKGDAAHRVEYGVTGWLNLVVLFYAALLAALLASLFLADTPAMRPRYFEWATAAQIGYLALIGCTLSTLLTALFKHGRVIDFAVLGVIVWVAAAAFGAPIGNVLPALPPFVVIVGGLALQLLCIVYLMLGVRPNLTYLNRVRKEG